MQRRPQRVLAASAAALTAVTLAACASSDRDSGSGEEGGGGEAASGGTLVFGAAGDPAMPGPAFGSDRQTFRLARQVPGGLLGNGVGGTEAVPELAEDYEVSEDGLE